MTAPDGQVSAGGETVVYQEFAVPLFRTCVKTHPIPARVAAGEAGDQNHNPSGLERARIVPVPFAASSVRMGAPAPCRGCPDVVTIGLTASPVGSGLGRQADERQKGTLG